MHSPNRWRPRVLPLLLTATLLAALPPAVHAESPAVGPAGQLLVTDQKTTPVGPGMNLTSFDRFDARGWMRGYILQVDLNNPGISADVIHPGTMTKAERLSAYAARAGAIAAVNGDYFDINGTNATLGAVLQNGQLLKSGVPSWTRVIGVGEDRIGRLTDLLVSGTIVLPTGELPLGGLNQLGLANGAIGMYTPLWGSAPLKSVASGGAPRQVAVVDGKVTANSTVVGNEPIPANGYVLIGREGGATALAGLKVGDPVSVRYAPKSDAAAPFHFAVGGNQTLVKDGVVPADLDDKDDAHSRTAAGFTADGRRMILVTVDGRVQQSRGASLKEMGEMLKAAGAQNAINLDGGGSSTMLARAPGEGVAALVNTPSDGSERPIPNGIGFFSAPGSGKLAGLQVAPASAAAHADRVFPGLSRVFVAKGHDENFGPVAAGDVKWQAHPADAGSVSADGVFTGGKPGETLVEAKVGEVKGSAPVRVLGALDRLATSPEQIGLDLGGSAAFTVVGYDAAAYGAPIDPRDVTLSYDDKVVTITATADGAYQVTPLTEGATLVTVKAGGKQAFLPVTVGLTTKPVSGFDDAAAWSVSKFPTEVGAAIAAVPGRTGQALQLDYDFGTSTATRAAYIQPAGGQLLPLPDRPQKVGLWVNGDGKGAWLRMVLRDAVGTNYTLSLAQHVDWTGWKYTETAVPAGVQYPLSIYRIYPVETVRANQYTGRLQFDDLVVRVPAALDVPAQTQRPDPLIMENAALSSDRWKFAVLGDLHIAGKAPDSKDVANVRTALRQALAGGAEFIVIDGDFVDTAYPEDFALAKRLLAEEVGDRAKVYYVPGNHEIMGTGNLENFTAAFGQGRFTFDHKGTRFILLNSATGSFRTSEFQQWLDMVQSLADAAQNPAVKNVVVMGHHPTRDPMPTASSQLSDQREARLLEQYLTQFRERSGGKGALYVSGHAHVVDVRRVEGVPYTVLGPVGKTPYGPSDKGGFYAWNLFGVTTQSGGGNHEGQGNEQGNNGAQGIEQGNNGGKDDWIRAEVRPILNSVTLEAPAQLGVGATAALKATGHQAAGYTFPLRYPATVTWSGSDNLFVGTGEAAAKAAKSGRYAAILDPATGELKALQPGQVTVRIEANGSSAEAAIRLTQ